jgi:hypothetical protein
MPLPSRRDLTAYRGDTLGVLLRLWQDDALTVPVDLTGATVRAQVRQKAADDPHTDFTVATSSNQIELSMSPALTSTLPATGVWDVEVDWASDGLNIQTVVAGTVTVSQDVTRVAAP